MLKMHGKATTLTWLDHENTDKEELTPSDLKPYTKVHFNYPNIS